MRVRHVKLCGQLARSVLIFIFFLAALAASPCFPQVFKETQKHWRETDSETLWIGRYGNCDYGSFVSLPKGVIAHGDKSPSPNHGFLVDLGSPDRVDFVGWEGRRRLGVNIQYWMESVKGRAHPNLADSVERQLRLSREAHPKLRVRERIQTTLDGIPAWYIRMEFDKAGEEFVEVHLLALRSEQAIEYGVWMVTPKINYADDKLIFDQVVGGFKVAKIPHGECSND